MGGIVWSGMDFSDLEHRILAIVEEIEIDARQILQDIALEVTADMRRIIAQAVTDTGRERAASGEGLGQPGRIETSAMISDVTYALDTNAGGEVVLTWGWVDNLEDYYLIQENGNSRIKAMSALQQSYVKGREKLRDRLRDMGLEVS